MKPGFVRCPLCTRPVQLTPGGFMRIHWKSFSKPGGGFRTLSEKCLGSNKRLEEL